MIKYIDNDEEHYQILYELGHLDDLEDWYLFCKQEERYDIDIDNETYLKYVNISRRIK